MKRMYQTPTTDCYKIESQKMIAMSLGDGTDAQEGNLSREFDYDVDFGDESLIDTDNYDISSWME